jgi:hypothetical protein
MAKAGLINSTPSRPNAAEEAAKLQLRVAYEIAVIMMGERAVSRFLMVLQKKPRGRPKGSTDPKRDQIVLAFYDWLEARPDQLGSRRPPQWIGQYLHQTHPRQFGNSANAIATKVKRLVKQRAREHALDLEKRRQTERCAPTP